MSRIAAEVREAVDNDSITGAKPDRAGITATDGPIATVRASVEGVGASPQESTAAPECPEIDRVTRRPQPLRPHVYTCEGCLRRTTFRLAAEYVPFRRWLLTCRHCRARRGAPVR